MLAGDLFERSEERQLLLPAVKLAADRNRLTPVIIKVYTSCPKRLDYVPLNAGGSNITGVPFQRQPFKDAAIREDHYSPPSHRIDNPLLGRSNFS